MPPWTIPNRADGLSPWASRQRAAQRRDISMDARACSSVAGYGVQSSKIMTMSEPSARCTAMDSSGPMNSALPSTGERK